MKILLFVALLACVIIASPIKAYEEDSKIKFEFEPHQQSPFGIMMEGMIDPRNDMNNKIQTFLKIANQYIPILESLGNANGELKWERTWNIDVAGIQVTVYYYFQLIVGWRVTPGGYTTDRFDVTYTPFAFGETYGSADGTTWPASGKAEGRIVYLDTYAPIGVQLFKQGKICFQGSYVVEAAWFRNHLYGTLKQCKDEILDDLIEQRSPLFNWQCEDVSPVNITIWERNFTDRLAGDFIPQTCFEF